MPTHVFISNREDLDHDSIIMCEQIRTIDKSRLIKYLAKVSNKEMQQVDEAIDVSVGVEN